MKVTRHNGRASGGKAYSSKHNDRKFDLEHAQHIDEERAAANIYWDCFNGFHTSPPGESPGEDSFEAVEKEYYHLEFHDFVDAQNERNAQNRHTERNRTTEDLRMDRRTCPEETIYQIGNIDDHVTADVLFDVVSDYLKRFTELYKGNVQVIDLALHVDESTPHIHERHVFECENKYGETCPQQEKALEKLGFDLPDPDKKPGRYNNRKMTFDSACRALFFDVCKEHGLYLDEEPEYGGRKYLEKQDFIRMKQKETIAEQNVTIAEKDKVIAEKDVTIAAKEERSEELSAKIEDEETLIDEVSEAAYNKAVEVVTNVVREETMKEDLSVIDSCQKKINSDSRFSPAALKVVNNVFGVITNAFRDAAKKIQKSVDNVLKKPEIKDAGVGAVREETRSVLAKLRAAQGESKKRDQERRGTEPDKEKDKKKNIELR